MSQLTCPRCGVGVLPSEAVCWNCGGKLAAEEAPPVEEPQVASAKPEPAVPLTTSTAKGLLPIGLHLFLYIAGSMVGFLGGAIIGAAVGVALLRPGMGFLNIVLFFGGAILGLHIPRLIMRHILTARCPKCGGVAVIEGSRPICYRCRNCGHLRKTSVSEGDSD